MSFEYTSQFVLDKSYFIECYEASVDDNLTVKHFTKAMLLTLVGIISLLFLQVSAYFGWFMIGLGVVDALGIYYRKPWWLTRQMYSKAANSEINLTIDEKGIETKSRFNQQKLLWQDVSELKLNQHGYLIIMQNQSKHYLSARNLSDEAKAFIEAKCSPIEG